jgi:hypothetical protein
MEHVIPFADVVWYIMDRKMLSSEKTQYFLNVFWKFPVSGPHHRGRETASTEVNFARYPVLSQSAALWIDPASRASSQTGIAAYYFRVILLRALCNDVS